MEYPIATLLPYYNIATHIYTYLHIHMVYIHVTMWHDDTQYNVYTCIHIRYTMPLEITIIWQAIEVWQH